MSKNEKIKFEDLEKLGDGRPEQTNFSEDELLEILKDQKRLDKAFEGGRIDFLRVLFERLSSSDEFRTRVLEFLEKKRGETIEVKK